MKLALDRRRRDGESYNDVLERLLDEDSKVGDFDDGYGRWSDDETACVHEGRGQSKEKRKERIRKRTEDGT